MSRCTILDILDSYPPSFPVWETPRNGCSSFPLNTSPVCSPYVFNQDAIVLTPDAPSYVNFSTSTPLKPPMLAEVSTPYYIERASTASSVDSPPYSKLIMQALDKDGSRILQKSLADAPPLAIAGIVEELLPHIQTVMCDTYANYMCQSLFLITSVSQRVRLLSSLSVSFVAVARDRRGTHSLQRLLSHVDSDEEREVVARAVRGKVVQLSTDCHATHVLQQALSSLAPTHVSWIYEELVANATVLSVDQFALGVVKRAIALAEPCGFAAALGARLDHSLFQLVEDAYGNYAVQHAIEHWSRLPASAGAHSARKISSRLADRVISLSCHKFASNVIEAIIRVGDAQLRSRVVKSLVQSPDTILSLMRSPFPVFVVATALKFCPSAQLSHALLTLISVNLAKAGMDAKNRTKWEKLENSEKR